VPANLSAGTVNTVRELYLASLLDDDVSELDGIPWIGGGIRPGRRVGMIGGLCAEVAELSAERAPEPD
jgi:hypothetical protein